ncbi:MAG: lactonase family protein [Pirellulaceae bacterium]|nr:lactonase family protein [Pirellulaceae bacterium]
MKFQIVFPLLFVAVPMPSTPAKADNPLVFISAFAPQGQAAIHAFELNDETGSLKALAGNSDVEHPFFMALSPDNRFLYSIHAESFGGKENQIASYALKGRTGKLKLLNRRTTRGRASCYIDVDASGKTVVVSNYATGDVASYPVNYDGSLGEMASYFKHNGSSVDPKRQKAPYAHCFVISPDNRFALAADLGIDKVMSYRLEAKSAKLTPNKPAFARLAPGAGPRHLTFHPHGKFVYVINEMGNTITKFDYAAKTGTLSKGQTISTLPEDYKETTHTADLKITPDGKFLYGTNRGHDSIAAYKIASDGTLTLIEIKSSLGEGPQNLAISPSGRYVLCANMPGDNVIVFAIDAKTGKLNAVGDPVRTPKPSCVMIVK